MSGFDELYRENILDHYRHPRCHGTLDPADRTVEDANPLCGDRIRMDFRIRDGVLEAVRFSGHGCSISQASASMLCERIEGRPLDEVKTIGRDDVIEMLGVPLGPVRLKCALLALKAMKAGVYGLTLGDEDDA